MKKYCISKSFLSSLSGSWCTIQYAKVFAQSEDWALAKYQKVLSENPEMYYGQTFSVSSENDVTILSGNRPFKSDVLDVKDFSFSSTF